MKCLPLISRERTVPEGIHIGTVLMKILLWLEVAALVKPQKWFHANLMQQLLFLRVDLINLFNFLLTNRQTMHKHGRPPSGSTERSHGACWKCSLTHKPDMEFLEVLTEGLERVLLVRGGGSEVITIYSWLANHRKPVSNQQSAESVWVGMEGGGPSLAAVTPITAALSSFLLSSEQFPWFPFHLWRHVNTTPQKQQQSHVFVCLCHPKSSLICWRDQQCVLKTNKQTNSARSVRASHWWDSGLFFRTECILEEYRSLFSEVWMFKIHECSFI